MKSKILTIALFMTFQGVSYSQIPRNVIMYIGDGFGIAPKTAARMAMGQGTDGKKFSSDPGFQILALDKLRYSNTVTTHSQNSWITDSGPGASAYACGKNGKIDNEAISYSVSQGMAVQTILEEAKKEGYAVGIVTTTRVTHATPAAFASHIWFRDLEDYIAAQFIATTQAEYESFYNDPNSTIKPYDAARDWILPTPKTGVEIDVILGGGARHFLPKNYKDTILDHSGAPLLPVVINTGKRSDNVNLITYAKKEGYVYVNSRDALMNLDLNQFTAANSKKVIGLFNSSHMNYEQDRQLNAGWEPSLFEMTEMAISILKKKGGKKGFFLLVEGGRIDHLNHANEGGITVVAAGTGNAYTVDADKEVYVGGGEANYTATPSTARQAGIYGSDYMIKEVLAYDYAVEQGRKLLTESTSRTLLMTSSDHECGGMAVVGLHDEADAQANSTKVRTYAMGPKQSGIKATSSGAANIGTKATPSAITRGDVDFGTASPEGWFPNYTKATFQGRPELWPHVGTTDHRIVIAFGSNPLTNGNGTTAGGTAGNHTPQDVLVCADDNEQGNYAKKITGKGLLDNTDLTNVMGDFLKLEHFNVLTSERLRAADTAAHPTVAIFPNPTNGSNSSIQIYLPDADDLEIQIYNIAGQLFKTFPKGRFEKGVNSIEWNEKDNKGGELPTGNYLIRVKGLKKSFSNKFIKAATQ